MLRNRKRYNLILACIFITIGFLIITQFSSDEYKNWISFKKEYMNSYPVIKSIEIAGSGPGLLIIINLLDDVDFEEAEDMFNKLKSQPIKVFEDLEKMHSKKNGYIEEIRIVFSSKPHDRDDNYVFWSRREEKSDNLGFNSFKKWIVERNNTSQ